MSDTTICHTQAHLHISHKAQNETCKTNSTPATCTFMRIGNNSEPLRVPENHMYKWLFHTCKLINHRSTKSIYEYAYGHQYQQYTNHTCIVLMIQHANAHEKKKQKTHNGPEKHGGSRTLVLQGLRPLQPKPNMADTHSHHWDHKNTFNFAPTRSRNSLALGIPQLIRFIWDPQNCTTYVYTDFALSPTNHHNQKQNMPLPSKMNQIHIKSLNSQHI